MLIMPSRQGVLKGTIFFRFFILVTKSCSIFAAQMVLWAGLLLLEKRETGAKPVQTGCREVPLKRVQHFCKSLTRNKSSVGKAMDTGTSRKTCHWQKETNFLPAQRKFANNGVSFQKSKHRKSCLSTDAKPIINIKNTIEYEEVLSFFSLSALYESVPDSDTPWAT